MGRFISEDGEWGKDKDPLSLNLYTYCWNNPIMFIDPSGFTIRTPDHSNSLFSKEYWMDWFKCTWDNLFTYDKQDFFSDMDAFGAAIPEGGEVGKGIFSFGKWISGLGKAQKVSVWTLNVFDRGWAIEKMLGGWCNNFPVIDKAGQIVNNFRTSITSIKSMDLFAKSYQKGNSVYNAVMGYTKDLARLYFQKLG